MMESLGGKYEPVEGGQRWVGRGWIPAAIALHRKGKTLSEIAEMLNMSREAVVKALYWDVVK
mgnify:CR=1 FL=1